MVFSGLNQFQQTVLNHNREKQSMYSSVFQLTKLCNRYSIASLLVFKLPESFGRKTTSQYLCKYCVKFDRMTHTQILSNIMISKIKTFEWNLPFPE